LQFAHKEKKQTNKTAQINILAKNLRGRAAKFEDDSEKIFK